MSITQPWAWLIAHGYKDVENRKWSTDYRGPLLIHASRGWNQVGFEFIIEQMDEWVPEKEKHVFGALVGIVDLIDCVDQHESKWFFGPWGFVLEKARWFEKSIVYPGQLKFFHVPDLLLKQKGILE